jgi:hypothetical protein
MKLKARRIVRAGFHCLMPKTNVETDHGDGRHQDEAKKPPSNNRSFIWSIAIRLLQIAQSSLPVIYRQRAHLEASLCRA